MTIKNKDVDSISGLTYIICPEKSCRLFWDTSRFCPCERDCPKIGEMKKAVICFRCLQVIILDGNDSWAKRIDCQCGASTFCRMSGRYQLVYSQAEIKIKAP